MSEVQKPQPQIPDPVPVLHPFLFALYPVVGLYAHNLGVTRMASMFRPAGLLFFLVLGLLVFFTAVLRRVHKAGVVTTIIILTGLSGWGVLSFLMRTTLPYVGMIPTPVYFVTYLIIQIAAVVVIVWYWWSHPRKAIAYAVGFTAAFMAVPILAELVFLGGPNRGSSWYVSLYLVIAAIVFIAALVHRGDFVQWTRGLNWFSVILTGLYIGLILFNRSNLAVADVPPLEINEEDALVANAEKEALPDIYFIVLDGYPRSDVLRRRFGFNNMMFEATMEELGFHVATKSHTNYTDPELSIGACLNMDFVQNLAPDETNLTAMRNGLYHYNRLFPLLSKGGYRIQAFSPGVDSLEPRGRVHEVLKPHRSLSEFELVLVSESVLSPILQSYYSREYGNPAYWRVEPRRRRSLFAFEKLEHLAQQPREAPRFIMSHLLIPSAPFVFDRHGGRARPFGPGAMGGDTTFVGSENQYRYAYIDQLHYLNERIEQMARGILANASQPPVIVIVSSRGFDPGMDLPDMDASGHRARLASMVMTYLPSDLPGSSTPYDTISLVNVFRIVLNRIYGLDLALLPDIAYESPSEAPLQFRRVQP